MDHIAKNDIARRNKRLALIHVAIALGFLAAFVFTTVRG